MAKRIQRKRTKGWKMPEGAVYVGRPSKWGNPYSLEGLGYRGLYFVVNENSGRYVTTSAMTKEQAIKHAVNCFRAYAPALDLSELRGKDLACWCPLVDENGNRVPCHADVLLELANETR